MGPSPRSGELPQGPNAGVSCRILALDTVTDRHMLFEAQEYMAKSKLDGWLLYDYRQLNPFFQLVLGPLPMVTRPALLFIPARGDAVLLVHNVDLGRFSNLSHRRMEYTSQASLLDQVSVHQK